MITIAQNTPLCKVIYDRSAREYIVANGREIARFPSGPANKVAAQWLAIQHDAPDVYEIAREMLAETLADEGRVIRAAQIVIAGDLITSHHRDRADGLNDFTQARVLSQTTPAHEGRPEYNVIHNLRWTCTCEDYDRHGWGHRCKHTLAVELTERMDDDFAAIARRKWDDKIERRQDYIPFDGEPVPVDEDYNPYGLQPAF